MAALQGLISVGLRLNKEAESLGASPRKGAAPAPAGPTEPAKAICSMSLG
jgi:hypothetical protein